ncbi:MAG: hypothetical protein ACPGVU_02245, partial [Limisphaerales bacterium]
FEDVVLIVGYQNVRHGGRNHWHAGKSTVWGWTWRTQWTKYGQMKTRVMILIVGVCAVLNLAAAEVGRYQITSSMSGVYFLDAATGELWRRADEGEWVKVNSPASKVANAPEIKKVPVSIGLPTAGESLTISQREVRSVPGSKGSLKLRLADVTAGQALVEVYDQSGLMFLDRTSLKDGEFASFEVKGKNVYLQITEMVNKLIGRDFCVVKFSFVKPVVEEK